MKQLAVVHVRGYLVILSISSLLQAIAVAHALLTFFPIKETATPIWDASKLYVATFASPQTSILPLSCMPFQVLRHQQWGGLLLLIPSVVVTIVSHSTWPHNPRFREVTL